jgi:hypothetical protein
MTEWREYWLAGRLACRKAGWQETGWQEDWLQGDWLSGRLVVNKTKLICWQFGWLQVMAGTNIG